MVETAEKLLEVNDYVRPREVVAIVAGTRTKSGSTNFMRLHVMGEQQLEGYRFKLPHDKEAVEGASAESKPKRAARKPKTFKRYPSPNPPKISNP
jgi:pyruvate kinase